MPGSALATALTLLSAVEALAAVPERIYVYDMNGASDSQKTLMAGVMGIVARSSPEVFMAWPGPSSPGNPKFWLDKLTAKYPSLTVEWHGDPAWFISRYQSHFNGYVLYDSDSRNEASSVAGVLSAIMVDSTTQHYAASAGLSQIADARGKNAAWVYANYGSQLNKDYIFNQFTYAVYQLRDFAIYKGGFMFFDPPDQSTYYANQNDHSRVFGWGDERQFFGRASQNNLMALAADWLNGASATSQWTMLLHRQSTHTPVDAATESGKHYAAFVMSDGDNVQWLTNTFAASDWWGSPHRGNFNMTWDMTPSLGEISPVAFNYYYESASSGQHQDFFVNAHGPGTIYPSWYPDINGFVPVNSRFMRVADHNIISVLDPDWNTSKLDKILDDPEVMGMMYKTDYDFYKGKHGLIHWRSGKPCATVKYSLWDAGGAETPPGLVSALNNAPTDPLGNQQSYSVINVHPWSTYYLGDPMSNVDYVVQNLDSNVKVVTLEELIIHLRNNFGTPVPPPQTPYLEAPQTIPGTVQAEYFDSGGEGVGYHDSDSANLGGQLRPGEGVDIEVCADAGGGWNVGWIAAGEWVEYTVNVSANGDYDFKVRVASESAGGEFHIEMNGRNVTGPQSFTATGGWQNWTTVEVPGITLFAGDNQVVRVAMDGAGWNLNHIEITPHIDPPGKATNPNPPHLATGVRTNADLTWTAAAGATSYNVYFGTSDLPSFRDNVPGTVFDPGAMAPQTDHFWRIDAVNDGGTTPGDVWTFTTGSGPGDFDGDGDVDQEDFGCFQECLTGSGVPQTDPDCQDARLDHDEDVDQDDFGIFQACTSGPNVPPAPGCAG